MRWGSKGDKGCKGDCNKLHPVVCPSSLDLMCTKKNCDYRLHVSKCKRKTRFSDETNEDNVKDKPNFRGRSTKDVSSDTCKQCTSASRQTCAPEPCCV